MTRLFVDASTFLLRQRCAFYVRPADASQKATDKAHAYEQTKCRRARTLHRSRARRVAGEGVPRERRSVAVYSRLRLFGSCVQQALSLSVTVKRDRTCVFHSYSLYDHVHYRRRCAL